MDCINDLTARNVLLWVVPFATYLIAEEVKASGVIAVVVAAIELNSRQSIEAETLLSGEPSQWSAIPSATIQERSAHIALDAAMDVVKENVDKLDPEVAEGVRRWITSRLDPTGATHAHVLQERHSRLKIYKAAYKIRAEAIAAAPEALLNARQAPRMNPGVVDEVLREVDRFALVAHRGVQDTE